MSTRGIRPDPLLHRSGLELPRSDSALALMPLAAYVQFFEQAARACHDLHLGLRLGKFDDPGNLGTLGYLFMSGASLLDAFEGFCGHLDALQEGTVSRLHIDGDAVTVQYRITDATIRCRRQDSEYSISAMYNLTRLYSGGQTGPRHVCFKHKQSGRYSIYRDVFGCEVSFEQPFNALIFQRDGFNIRTRRFIHLLNPILTSHFDALSANRVLSKVFKTRVTDIIDAQLAEGECSQERVARELGLSVSTLTRRLRAEGASYRDLLGDRRLDTAERLLNQDDGLVANVALAAGYTATASF